MTRTNQDRAEALLTTDDVRHEFPVRKGTLGPDVIDIGALYQRTGHFAYDPGFISTASCESKITFIDGDKGVLLYRGYPIDQLAGRSDFVETCYLLLYSHLPTREQYQAFRNHVVNHTMGEFACCGSKATSSPLSMRLSLSARSPH